MKRDLDLIRLILRDIETIPAGEPYVNIEKLSGHGYDDATIYGHIAYLIDCTMIRGKMLDGGFGSGIVAIDITGITREGYDFLDATRDEQLFNKAKEKFLKPAAAFTIDIVLEWLKFQIKNSLQLP